VEPANYTFRFYFPIATTDTTCTVTFTTINGLTYTYVITLASINLANPCLTAVVITDAVTYPVVPDDYGVTLDAINETLILNSITFGQTFSNATAALLPGIYCVTLKGVNS